jgi:hypothetical protein
VAFRPAVAAVLIAIRGSLLRMFRPSLSLSLATVAAVLCAPSPHPSAASDQATALVQVLVPRLAWHRDGWHADTALPPPVAESLKPLEFICPAEDEEWIEGRAYTVVWQWQGPIARVSLSFDYEVVGLANRTRGKESIEVTGRSANHGYATFVPRWIDGKGFTLHLDGYDAAGVRVASCERLVRFRPAEAADIHGTLIVILRDHQRLYFFRDDKLTRLHIISTARGGYVTPRMWPGLVHGGLRMGQVFYKDEYAWSNQYHCPMPFWMAITSSGSHGIHATTPGAYRHLGSPASHGCVRQHLEDAKILYSMVKVGTPVYVF